jgi:hypothetical protein
MFNSNRLLIDAFVAYSEQAYQEVFPGLDPALSSGLERAARTALGTLLNCDCPYHDLEHTMLVTDAGMTILRGRVLSRGDLAPQAWLQAVVALLCHDLGYLRGLLKEDLDGSYLADDLGARVSPPRGATDAYLMPYHVARSCMFVRERFARDPVIDTTAVTEYIDMTRFPVPDESQYQRVDTLGALVRGADLIGQMGDPAYGKKQAMLFWEFQETGEAARLGYGNPAELRADFPEFFYERVYPYLGDSLAYLHKTSEGQQWIANLFHHVHARQSAEASSSNTSAPGWLPERSLYDYLERNTTGDAISHISIRKR